jgi:hypothetical protein
VFQANLLPPSSIQAHNPFTLVMEAAGFSEILEYVCNTTQLHIQKTVG